LGRAPRLFRVPASIISGVGFTGITSFDFVRTLVFAFGFTFFGESFFYSFPDNLLNIGNNRPVQPFKGFYRGGRHFKKQVGFNVKGGGKAVQHFGCGEFAARLNGGKVLGRNIRQFRQFILRKTAPAAVFFQISCQYFPDISHPFLPI
jgi:hypothetical protein